MADRRTSRPKVDWLMVRAAFESSEFSDRSLAREYGVTPKAIRNRSAREGWARSSSSAPDSAPEPEFEEARGLPVEVTISPALALAAADQKSIVDRGRDLTFRLLDELNATTAYVGELEDMILAETAGDRDGQRRHAMLKAVGLPTRAAVLKNLAMAAKTLTEAAPGKKDEAREAAKSAGAGRFSTPAAPKLVVNNG